MATGINWIELIKLLRKGGEGPGEVGSHSERRLEAKQRRQDGIMELYQEK